jgi:hypothetical protein
VAARVQAFEAHWGWDRRAKRGGGGDSSGHGLYVVAGLGPEAGLYANIAAMFAYTLFGTSRQLAVGVTSALSVMVAETLGTLALPGAEENLAATATIAASWCSA